MPTEPLGAAGHRTLQVLREHLRSFATPARQRVATRLAAARQRLLAAGHLLHYDDYRPHPTPALRPQPARLCAIEAGAPSTASELCLLHLLECTLQSKPSADPTVAHAQQHAAQVGSKAALMGYYHALAWERGGPWSSQAFDQTQHLYAAQRAHRPPPSYLVGGRCPSHPVRAYLGNHPTTGPSPADPWGMAALRLGESIDIALLNMVWADLPLEPPAPPLRAVYGLLSAYTAGQWEGQRSLTEIAQWLTRYPTIDPRWYRALQLAGGYPALALACQRQVEALQALDVTGIELSKVPTDQPAHAASPPVWDAAGVRVHLSHSVGEPLAQAVYAQAAAAGTPLIEGLRVHRDLSAVRALSYAQARAFAEGRSLVVHPELLATHPGQLVQLARWATAREQVRDQPLAPTPQQQRWAANRWRLHDLSWVPVLPDAGAAGSMDPTGARFLWAQFTKHLQAPASNPTPPPPSGGTDWSAIVRHAAPSSLWWKTPWVRVNLDAPTPEPVHQRTHHAVGAAATKPTCAAAPPTKAEVQATHPGSVPEWEALLDHTKSSAKGDVT